MFILLINIIFIHLDYFQWREVRLKNMMVNDWEKAAKYLSRRAVEVLVRPSLIFLTEKS
jgi:hypothetical protein